MKKPVSKPTIVNKKRLDEILQKISAVFVEERMSPFETKIALDVIYNNIEKLDDLYTKAQLTHALSKLEEEETPPGVS